MILELFFGLIAFSFILIFLAYLVNIPFFATIGFAFLFLLGLLLQGGGVEYKIGNTVTEDSSIETTIVYNYTNINDQTSIWVGRFLAIASIIGFAIVLANLRRDTR